MDVQSIIRPQLHAARRYIPHQATSFYAHAPFHTLHHLIPTSPLSVPPPTSLPPSIHPTTHPSQTPIPPIQDGSLQSGRRPHRDRRLARPRPRSRSSRPFSFPSPWLTAAVSRLRKAPRMAHLTLQKHTAARRENGQGAPARRHSPRGYGHDYESYCRCTLPLPLPLPFPSNLHPDSDMYCTGKFSYEFCLGRRSRSAAERPAFLRVSAE